jgi:hypothetical protein
MIFTIGLVALLCVMGSMITFVPTMGMKDDTKTTAKNDIKTSWFQPTGYDIWDIEACSQSVQDIDIGSNGTFIHDTACDARKSSVFNCLFHRGSKGCYRSRLPSSSGAGQQCCYKEDGNLNVDICGGGTADLVHPDTSLLGHVLYDVAPAIVWQKLLQPWGGCDVYVRRRPIYGLKWIENLDSFLYVF